MTAPPYNVLFLCTGDSARSILAEALLDRMSEGRFNAFSAGSQPKGSVHPMAMDLSRDGGFRHADLRSKSWEEFAGPASPRLDFIFTVCDNAAEESCPVWPGHPTTAHWGIADPASVEGDGQRKAFERALVLLAERISLLVALPIESLDADSLEQALVRIGLEAEAT